MELQEQQMKMELQDLLNKLDEKISAECSRLGKRIPYIAEQNCYQKDMREENASWWTNGFWAGILWQMYHATGKESYREAARLSEKNFDKALEEYTGLHHDVGFQFLHTAVADYKLTKREGARVRALHAANLLAGRFNVTGGYIRAWNLDKAGHMIVDSLMNIPLLYWAFQELGDPRYRDIADRHAHTAIRVLQRPDGSCNHIAILNPATGELLDFPKGQGYGPGSSWSRGQAWAVYGFALAFRYTGKQEYLDAAKRAAHYFLANTALTGFVSLADFRAPGEPVVWDTTASACAACGLLELSGSAPELEQKLYFKGGVKLLKALLESHCSWKPEEDGILQKGTVAYGREGETHVPIIYGDYFLVEGLLRLMGKSFFIW